MFYSLEKIKFSGLQKTKILAGIIVYQTNLFPANLFKPFLGKYWGIKEYTQSTLPATLKIATLPVRISNKNLPSFSF